MSYKHKIAFIMPWFGPLPKWMPAYLLSCQANDSIDFIFFTDNDSPQNLPENVIFNKISFTEYCQLVSKKLSISFNPDEAYKLCDIKPSYGKVHEGILKDYDFWGFADIDLVFGKIRHFLTEETLDNYDLFSTHGTRIAGHFCIMRNNEKWRNMFMNSPVWQESFEDKKHNAFDEKAFSNLFIGFKNYPKFMAKKLCNYFRPHSRRTLIKEMYSTPGCRQKWIDGTQNYPTEWYWNDGILTNNASNEQFLYFHFLKWKKYTWKDSQKISYLSAKSLGKNWRIIEDGFFANY